MMPVTPQDIRSAARRIADGVVVTPCPESIPLSEITGCRVFCKLDNLQRTGSFKERGARNALKLLSPEARKKGVVAASAGNHALGLAYHGQLLGIPVTVVMPDYAPLIKVSTCKRLGARVIVAGRDFTEARTEADQLVKTEGLTYVHGFDDPAIIAGQGTLALEVLKQVPQTDAIIVPVGGAGLLAGVAIAAKSINPKVRVIGVESKATASFTAALKAGGPITIPRKSTLADGLAVLRVGDNSFALARDLVDRIVDVDEKWIALAVLRLIEREKIVVEGAAAATLAAMLSGQLRELKGRNVVIALCGGNIDTAVLGRVIDRGLVADGRLCRCRVVINDRPGGLQALTRVIADAGASVRDIAHDRAFSGADVSAVHCICTLETQDAIHAGHVRKALRRAGFTVEAA